MAPSGDLAVQYSRLPQWLLARRVIPQDYARLLPGIDSKVQDALAESVKDEAASELIEKHRDAVTYFAARDIYEALARSAAGQAKTLLGGHTDSATAKWKAVLNAFRRSHLGWVSEARVLIQNATYEIPALKKHATACEKQISDCAARQADLERAETNARARYESLLKDLCIQGVNPRRELLDWAATELPKLHTEVEKVIQESITEIVEYYSIYARHAAGGDIAEDGGGGVEVPLLRSLAKKGGRVSIEELESCVPTLRELRASSDRRHASMPPSLAEPVAPATDGSDAIAGGIDWEIEVSSGGVAGETSGVGDAAVVAEGIDWNIVSTDGLEIIADEATEAVSQRDTVSLLTDVSVRELLYQEVVELDAFLRERCAELSPGGTAPGQVSGPPGMEETTLQHVQAFAAVTSRLDELLAGKNSQNLLLLLSSERYLGQTIQRLEVAKTLCHKPVAQRSALDRIKAEQAEEAKRTRAEIEALRTATRKRQQELEAELSAHFKSTVKIVGEINEV